SRLRVQLGTASATIRGGSGFGRCAEIADQEVGATFCRRAEIADQEVGATFWIEKEMSLHVMLPPEAVTRPGSCRAPRTPQPVTTDRNAAARARGRPGPS